MFFFNIEKEHMTIEILKQYRALKKEIVDINRQLEAYKFTDSVQGSMHGFPYVMQSHKVEGYCSDAKYLLDLRGKVVRQKAEIEKYIVGIEDSFIRQIFTLRYINGLRWQQIAFRIGGNNTKDSVRIAHSRFFKNN